jgi:hypothetical protein
MRRYLGFQKIDKEFIKMLNPTDVGFDLIVLNDEYLTKILKFVEYYSKELSIVWETKFNKETFVVFYECSISSIEDNYYGKNEEPKLCGKKLHITSSSKEYFTNNRNLIGRKVRNTKNIFKDGSKIIKLLKLSELDYKSEECIIN